MKRGGHYVKMVGFERGGGVYMSATYGKKHQPDQYIRSYQYGNDNHRRSKPRKRHDRLRGWSLKVFKGPTGMSVVPQSTHGMQYLGGSVVQSLRIPNPAAFRRKVKNVPDNNFVWVVGGTVAIKRSGHYRFCTTSDDGSKLWVNGRQVVNNDGLHGARQRCGSIHLRKGWQAVKSVGFQRGGGAYFDAVYSGPDTGGVKRTRAITSVKYRSYFFRRPAGFMMKIFKGPQGMSKVPSTTHGMALLGKAIVKKIYFPSDHYFRQSVPQTPNGDYVWVYGGVLYITR